MKIYKLVLFAFVFAGITASCSDDLDDEVDKPIIVEGRDLTVENYIYRGMNEIYLYKADVPVLADNYFSSQAEKNDFFLNNSDSPKDLFDNELTADESLDRFSFLVADYVELEEYFKGLSKTSGLSYGLRKYCDNCNEIFGFVRLVLPNTSAEEEGVERGMIFNRVDGQQLTVANYEQLLLLAPDTFTIGMAKLEESTISNLDETFTLTKREYEKNPVFVSKVIETEGKKVGYLYYDSFTAEYDRELNDAFGDFKAANVTDLVLDLRYNGGGSVRTATDLASMITGQFPDDIFMKEEWNADYQSYFEREDPERLLNRFNTTLKTDEAINSLNLGKVYVLTTNRSASASELIINGLDPHIDVIQIGENTTGKFQASVTLYDSPNFQKRDVKGNLHVNTTHTYVIQPLVLKSMNAFGVPYLENGLLDPDFKNGLVPDYAISEDYENLGQLGDPDEPFLKLALDVILGRRISIPEQIEQFKPVGESGMDQLDYQKMYIDKIPELIKK